MPEFPHGWRDDHTWLPFPPDAATLDVASQRADPGSILHLYRRLLGVRHDSPALRLGEFTWVETHGNVLAWRRRCGDDERVVAVNFADHEVEVALTGAWERQVTSDGQGEGTSYDGCVQAEQAVLLRRAG